MIAVLEIEDNFKDAESYDDDASSLIKMVMVMLIIGRGVEIKKMMEDEITSIHRADKDADRISIIKNIPD